MDVRRVDVRHFPPEPRGFAVRLQPLGRVALKIRRVQPGLVDAPDAGQQLPGPGDGLRLEIVAERPVPQHLEERVVVRVLPHVVQVVVLAARPDALLRIRRPAVRPGAGAQEDVLELVHPRVGEHQRRIVRRHHRRRRHNRMPLAREEIEKLLPDFP